MITFATLYLIGQAMAWMMVLSLGIAIFTLPFMDGE